MEQKAIDQLKKHIAKMEGLLLIVQNFIDDPVATDEEPNRMALDGLWSLWSDIDTTSSKLNAELFLLADAWELANEKWRDTYTPGWRESDPEADRFEDLIRKRYGDNYPPHMADYWLA
jgi:hypothetical protein